MILMTMILFKSAYLIANMLIWMMMTSMILFGAYQSVTNIFKYSNILITNIYSDIRLCQFFFYKCIWIFVCTNLYIYIFRHAFASACKNWTNIWIYKNIHKIFFTNIYSDIRSCQICYPNIFEHSFVYICIFGYSFVSKFSRMSHSGAYLVVNMLMLIWMMMMSMILFGS